MWSDKDDVDRARNTLISLQESPDRRDQVSHISWHQNGIFASRLGMTELAYEYLVKKMSDNNSGYRFPAFWGPGHDWMPDHNWGGSGAINLQEMLVQTHESKIYLLPAWPKELDVSFKLWIEKDTCIICCYNNRKLDYSIQNVNDNGKKHSKIYEVYFE